MSQMAATADFDPDQPVIEAIQRGDHGAFRDLLRREDRWVRGVVFAVLGDRQRVDDVSQQVWTAVWERAGELRDVQRWRPWLYRLARNAAIDAGREATRQRQLADRLTADAVVPDARVPSDDIARRERLVAVRQAIEALPPRYREVLTLRHLEGWSYRQIADVLEVPIDTVETRLVRARRKLRESLEGWVDL
jgi:RNA polymerase sigma-70 factor (ECF subfamily)